MVNARLYIDCPPGYWMYKCASIGLETCCSVDACQLGGCPIDARPSSAAGQQWGAVTVSTTSTLNPNPAPTTSLGKFPAPSLEDVEAHTTETKWITIPSTTFTAWVTATEWNEPAATDGVAGAAPIPPPQSTSPAIVAVSSGANSLQPGAVAGISVGLVIGLVFFAILSCFLYCGRSEEKPNKQNTSKEIQPSKVADALQEVSGGGNIWPQMSSRSKSQRDMKDHRKPRSLLKKAPKIVVEHSLSAGMPGLLAVGALPEQPNGLCLSPSNVVEQNSVSRSHFTYSNAAVSPVSAHSITSTDEISQLDSSPLKPEFELDSIPIPAARPGYAELESPTLPCFELSPPPPPRRSDMPSHSNHRSYAPTPSSCYSSPALSPAVETSLLEQPRATLSPTAAERAWKIPVNSWSTYMG